MSTTASPHAHCSGTGAYSTDAATRRKTLAGISRLNIRRPLPEDFTSHILVTGEEVSHILDAPPPRLTGVAAAIANVVHHATGIRVRERPKPAARRKPSRQDGPNDYKEKRH
jgi:hypothetical protein